MVDTKKIKKMLIDKDMSCAQLAKETGYSSVHISNVIHGKVKSPKAERLVSFVLGRTREELFGCNDTLRG